MMAVIALLLYVLIGFYYGGVFYRNGVNNRLKHIVLASLIVSVIWPISLIFGIGMNVVNKK